MQNKHQWLVKMCHTTCNIQSECFISANHCYVTQKVVHDIASWWVLFLEQAMLRFPTLLFALLMHYKEGQSKQSRPTTFNEIKSWPPKRSSRGDSKCPILVRRHLQWKRFSNPDISCSHGRRLIIKRSWVRISAPDTGWTFFSLICCK